MNISDNLPLVLVIAGIINLLLLYLVINIATKAEKRAKYEWAQMEILIKIARKQGVSEEEIQQIVKGAK